MRIKENTTFINKVLNFRLKLGIFMNRGIKVLPGKLQKGYDLSSEHERLIELHFEEENNFMEQMIYEPYGLETLGQTKKKGELKRKDILKRKENS